MNVGLIRDDCLRWVLQLRDALLGRVDQIVDTRFRDIAPATGLHIPLIIFG